MNKQLFAKLMYMVIVLAVMSSISVGEETGNHTLRYGWHKGDNLIVNMETSSETATFNKETMKEVVVDNVKLITYQLVVVSVDGNGTAEIEVKVKKVKVHIFVDNELAMTVGTGEYHSGKWEVLGEFFNVMQEFSYSVTVNNRGKVCKVRGLEEFGDLIREWLEKHEPDIEKRAQFDVVLEGVTDERNIKGVLNMAFPRLPEAAVGVGDTWTVDLTIPLEIESDIIVTQEFELTSLPSDSNGYGIKGTNRRDFRSSRKNIRLEITDQESEINGFLDAASCLPSTYSVSDKSMNKLFVDDEYIKDSDEEYSLSTGAITRDLLAGWLDRFDSSDEGIKKSAVEGIMLILYSGGVDWKIQAITGIRGDPKDYSYELHKAVEYRLIALLEDKDPGVRIAAIKTLVSHRRGIFEISKLGNKGSDEQKLEVVKALGVILKKCNFDDVIIPQLKSENSLLCTEAIRALVTLAGSCWKPQDKKLDEYCSVIMPLLERSDQAVRRDAVVALADLQYEELFSVIEPLLKDESPEVRRAAVQAFMLEVSGEHMSSLMPLLKDDDIKIRLNVIWMMVHTKAVELAAELVTIAKGQDLEDFVNDEALRLQRAAIRALGYLEQDSYADEVAGFLASEHLSLRNAAIFALGKMKASKYADEIAPFLTSETSYLRASAVQALGQIGAVDYVEEVVALLDDENYTVLENAIVALGKLQDATVAPKLAGALKDQLDSVRQAAAMTLIKLGGEGSLEVFKDVNSDEVHLFCSDIVDYLYSQKGKEYIPFMAVFLADSNTGLRSKAIKKVGEVEPHAYKSYFIEGLESEDSEVRAWSGIALVEIAKKELVPPGVKSDIFKLIQSLVYYGDDPEKRAEKAYSKLTSVAEYIKKMKTVDKKYNYEKYLEIRPGADRDVLETPDRWEHAYEDLKYYREDADSSESETSWMRHTPVEIKEEGIENNEQLTASDEQPLATSVDPGQDTPSAGGIIQGFPGYQSISSENLVSWLNYSRDGHLIAGCNGKTISVWNAESGIKVIDIETNFEIATNPVFTPDGSVVCVGTYYNKSVEFWNSQTGQYIGGFPQHPDYITDLAFKPDGSMLATVCYDGTIRFWNAMSGELITSISSPDELGTSVAYSPDGKSMAAGTEHGSIAVMNMESGDVREIGEKSGNKVHKMAFSPDGKVLAVAEEYIEYANWSIRILNVETAEKIKEISPYSSGITDIEFSPDGKWLATAGDDQIIRILGTGNWNEVYQICGHTQKVWSIAFHPEGAVLAAADNESKIHFWSPQIMMDRNLFWTGRLPDKDSYGSPVYLPVETKPLKGNTAAVGALVFHPDGKRVLSTGVDKSIRVWDLESGNEIQTFTGHTDWVGSLTFYPDLNRFATAGSDGTIRFWDLDSSSNERQLPSISGIVGLLIIHQDGKRFFEGGDDKIVRIRDLITGDILQEFKGHEYGITSGALSPDGTVLATAETSGNIRIWEADTGAELLVLKEHYSSVNSIAFSTDGSRLCSASGEGSVKVWDVKSGKLEATFYGSGEPVHRALFSPDGKNIIFSGDDKVIRIGDLASESEIINLVGHTSPVWNIVLSPDGRKIVSGDLKGKIYIWDYPGEL
jgi:WD40 repeat protein/HEAT repeat protein